MVGKLETREVLWNYCEFLLWPYKDYIYKEKCYVYNIFTTLSQQILYDILLLAITSE